MLMRTKTSSSLPLLGRRIPKATLDARSESSRICSDQQNAVLTLSSRRSSIGEPPKHMPTRNQIDLVGKTMRVLEVLAELEENANLKQIVAQVGLVKSSVFRILFSLEKLGYVEHADGKGAYRLTWKTIGLGRRSATRAKL